MTHRPTRRLAALATLAGAAAFLAAACSGGAGASPILTPRSAPAEPPASQPAGGIPAGCPTSAPAPLAAGDVATVTLATEKGDIIIAVKGSLAPNATGNFVALAECGYYDGVVFHRLMPGFVLQGGDGQYGRVPIADPTQMGYGGPGYTITDDPVTAPYGRGTVAMARTSEPNSVGSQFFIVLDDKDQAVLASANTYQIIGSVATGMDAVDAIYAAAAGQELPPNPIAMTKVTVSNP